jgi:hypothetical protein
LICLFVCHTALSRTPAQPPDQPPAPAQPAPQAELIQPQPAPGTEEPPGDQPEPVPAQALPFQSNADATKPDSGNPDSGAGQIDPERANAEERNFEDVNQGPLREPLLQHDAGDPRPLAGESERNDAADPLAAGPPKEEDDEAGPMEICAQPNTGYESVLQRVRRGLTVTACASSAWLDGLFGDQIYYAEYHDTHGTVTVGGLWSEYDGFDPRLRFRAHLQLPQWNERISAFAGRVGEDDYISDTENDFQALPTRQFGTLEDESVLVGLGYSKPERTGNDFDIGVGVRVDWPLDPYARVRYEIVRPFAERYVFTARETVFWQNTEGFGTTTRVNFDRIFSDRFLLRWSNLGKYTEETLGLEWYTQLTLFQSIGQRTGLAWQAQVEGATDNEVQLTRHALRLIMRRQLTPDWLILELRGGVGWPRRKLSEERKAGPEIGIAVEMQFGQKRERVRPH